MLIHINTAEPHSDKQRQVIEAFHTPGLEEMWIACGTKWGKTLSCSAAMISAAPLRRQTLWRWVGPIYRQAKIGFTYMRRMMPAAAIELNTSDPSITIKGQDTRIEFFHGQKPETLEGEASNGNVIDEGAKHKEATYHSVKTTVTQTRGPIIIPSTPLGKNWFYRGCMRAQEEMLRAKRERRRPKLIFIHAPTYDNPTVPAESIEAMRGSMPQRLFRQYVEAEFLDDGSVFMFLADALGHPTDWWTDDVWYATAHESRAIYVGADWAKKSDYSVFVAMNDQGRVVGYKRFQRLPYPAQVAALFAFCDQVKRNSILVAPHVAVEHDQTGVGEAIHDIIETQTHGVDVIGVTWTNKLKELYVSDLMMSFEEKAITLPPWFVFNQELSQFECSTTISGAVRYAAPAGQHDDSVMALVLANRMFRQARGVISVVGVVDTVNNVLRKIYYNGGVLEE